jgi:hypothetical protein
VDGGAGADERRAGRHLHHAARHVRAAIAA